MVLENFKPFIGQHCETTTTGCLLKRLDIRLSEPMLFGLGEGLGFIFWNMKSMDSHSKRIQVPQKRIETPGKRSGYL